MAMRSGGSDDRDRRATLRQGPILFGSINRDIKNDRGLGVPPGSWSIADTVADEIAAGRGKPAVFGPSRLPEPAV